MGNFRPLPTKCFEKFLAYMGYKYSRTSGSHDQWVKRDCRTVTIRGADKQVPALHLKTNCKTMGYNLESLYQWATDNC